MHDDRPLYRRASGCHSSDQTAAGPLRRSVGALALALAACAGDGADGDDGVPAFVPPATNAAAVPAVPGSGGSASAVTAPSGAGGDGSSAASAPPSDEAGAMPTALEPPGSGGSTSAGGPIATGAAGAGGNPASVAMAGAGGASAEASGGAGGASEPEPPPPSSSSCPPNALFCDDFEDDRAGQFPAAPWQNNTGSGASVVVDTLQAFSGVQAAHVNAPPNQAYRRGYFSLEQGSSNIFPAVSHDMFGRAMMFLDATPNAVVHWTIIQAEGRAADGSHDAYYRYGGQQQGGAGLMANYETNSGVSTDCYSHSATRMPVQRWVCVEWHFDADRNEMQLWLDGAELSDMHVIDRPTTPGAGCLGNATGGEWVAPPEFNTLHLGWESYQLSSNDRNLWIDDVAIGTQQLGCPEP